MGIILIKNVLKIDGSLRSYVYQLSKAAQRRLAAVLGTTLSVAYCGVSRPDSSRSELDNGNIFASTVALSDWSCFTVQRFNATPLVVVAWNCRPWGCSEQVARRSSHGIWYIRGSVVVYPRILWRFCVCVPTSHLSPNAVTIFPYERFTAVFDFLKLDLTVMLIF